MYAGSVLVVAFACLLGAALVGVIYLLVALLAPHNPYALKNATYECGHEPVGRPRSPFRVQYYCLAIVFLIFDIETAFAYPWGLVFRTMGWPALGEMAIFLAILLVGLLYAWRKGALRWE
jgi:NADH-quinone oxidoreductase subunit A